MKRVSMFILVIILMIFALGCPDKTDSKNEGEDQNKTNVKRIDKKSADLVVENYMRFLMVGNHGAMKSFYSVGLKKKLRIKAASAGIIPVGYSIGEADMMKQKANYKVNIYNSNRSGSYFSDDEFKYVVKIEGTKPVIDDISKEKSTEIFKEEDSLFERENEKLKGTKIISLKDLPNFITAKEASSIEQKFPMPKKDFGPCALSPDGKVIVFSSADKNSFIGILNKEEEASASVPVPAPVPKELALEGGVEIVKTAIAPSAVAVEDATSVVETLAMQWSKQEGQNKQGQSGGGSQESQGSSGQGGGSAGTSEGSNYKIKTVDLYFNSEVRNINFSQDGKLFVVEHRPNHGLSKISVYKSESGEKYILKSSQQFSTSRFSLTNPYFASPKELVFTLIPSSKASSAELKLKGTWRLDIEKGALKQF